MPNKSYVLEEVTSNFYFLHKSHQYWNSNKQMHNIDMNNATNECVIFVKSLVKVMLITCLLTHYVHMFLLTVKLPLSTDHTSD